MSTAGLDFARLIGEDGWRRLTPAIRERFSANPLPGRPIRFSGIMHEVRCSRIGWLLAQAGRLIGTPFAPHRGIDVPVTITLATTASGGIVWERIYHYPDHDAAVVRSEKRRTPEGGLTERVGFGCAMRLAVFESHGALHFRSLFYLWQIGRWHLTLPDLLSPGTAHVRHQDLGDGRFRFVMTISHRLLGTLYHQDGVFHEVETTP